MRVWDSPGHPGIGSRDGPLLGETPLRKNEQFTPQRSRGMQLSNIECIVADAV